MPALGGHHTEDWKHAMSLRMKGNTYSKGVVPSAETKEKIRQKKLGWKMPEEGRRRLSEARKQFMGVRNPAWKGGISLQPNYGAERSRVYRITHAEKAREKDQRYQKEHPEKNRLKSQLYRVRKLITGGNHSVGEWETLKAQYNWTCPCCKKQEPEIKLSEDHIVPVTKGGSNNIENIQPLCRTCNSRKNNKHATKYELVEAEE